MTKDEILKQSTPRPWRAEFGNEVTIETSSPQMSATVCVIQARVPSRTATANGNLIPLAVNSYEADQALIKQLVEALDAYHIAARQGFPPAEFKRASHLSCAALAAAKERQP